jgi:hypothetical protein
MPFKIRILPLAPKVLLFDCFSWVRYELKIGGEFILGHDSFYCFSRVNFKFLHQLLTLREPKLDIQYAEVGVCGLSCRLCSMYHTQTESRCAGCKSYARMAVGCPFITCAVKKKGIEFCWQCTENAACEKWRKHRDAGRQKDSFKCYQKLEDDILFIRNNGVAEFEKTAKIRENLLNEMLIGFNDGRSKSYYCIAATVLKIDELRDVLSQSKEQSKNMQLKDKAKVIHSILECLANEKGYLLKLRK